MLAPVRAVQPDDEQPAEDAVQTTPGRRAATGTRMPSGFTTLRDLISFVAGLAIVVNEVAISATVEVYALGAGLALMGLPLMLNADERRAK